MKKVISIVFFVLILILIFFSFFKIIRSIWSQNTFKRNQMLFSPTSEVKNEIHPQIQWKKNKIIVPYEFFQLQENQVGLDIGSKYVLVQIMMNSHRCLLGNFSFLSKSKKNLVFEADEKIRNSKLEPFAKVKNEKLFIAVFSREEYVQFIGNKEVKNCSDWVNFEYKTFEPKHFGYVNQNVELNVGKEKCFSYKKFFAIQLEKSNILKVHDNSLLQKICFKAVSEGYTYVSFMHSNNITVFNLQVSVIKKKSSGKNKNNSRNSRGLNTFDKELGLQYHLPGWKK